MANEEHSERHGPLHVNVSVRNKPTKNCIIPVVDTVGGRDFDLDLILGPSLQILAKPWATQTTDS